MNTEEELISMGFKGGKYDTTLSYKAGNFRIVYFRISENYMLLHGNAASLQMKFSTRHIFSLIKVLNENNEAHFATIQSP